MSASSCQHKQSVNEFVVLAEAISIRAQASNGQQKPAQSLHPHGHMLASFGQHQQCSMQSSNDSDVCECQHKPAPSAQGIAWPRPGLEIWESGNHTNPKNEDSKIKIHHAQNVGKVQINKKKHFSPPIWAYFRQNFPWAGQIQKHTCVFADFLGGPMAAIQPVWRRQLDACCTSSLKQAANREAS